MNGTESYSPSNRIVVVAGVIAILLASLAMPLYSYTGVLLGALGLGIVLALILNPYWLWMALFLFLPFSVELPNLVAAGTNLTFPTESFVPVVGVTILFALLRTGKVKWTLSPLHLASGIFFAVAAASLLRSAVPIVTLKALIRTMSYFLCGYVLTQVAIRKPSDLRPFFRFFVAANVGLVIYGFYTQFVEGVSIYQNIAHPFFQNHCIYAAWLCFPAAFVLGALTQPIANRGRLMLFLVVVLAGIMLSFVRGSWLGLVGLGVYLVFRHRAFLNVRTFLALAVLAIAAVAVVTILGLGEHFQDRWTNLFDRRYVTNESRIDRWMAALSMWKTRPLFGFGLGTYPDLYSNFIYYIYAFERSIRMGAHSIYFEIMAELGLVGLAAYFFILTAFFKETRRMFALATHDPNMRAIAIGLESVMVVYLIHGIVNNLGPSDKIDIAFWATCGLAVSMRCYLEKRASESSGLSQT